MNLFAVAWFLAGVLVGEIALALALALVRGPGREADEHEEGGV